MLTAAMLCAASAATASAEEVNVSADNLSVSDSSINASISYDTAAADGYVMASVYDESGRFKDVTFKKVTEGKTLDITMSPTDTVKASVWNLKQAKPLETSVELNKKGLQGIQKTEWDFETGKNVDARRDYSAADPTEWTFATGWWNDGQQYYEDAYPVLKDVSSATVGWTADYLVDTNYFNMGGTDYTPSGSTKCIEFTPSGNWNQNIAAIRVLLSNRQLQPGKKYKVSMYTKNIAGTRAIYSTLMTPGRKIYNGADNYVSNGTPNVTWANNLTASPVAYSNAFWTPYEFVIEPKAENFDADGYTNLWLAFTREFNSTEELHPSGTLRTPDTFWIDDLKIEEYTPHALEWTFENADADIGQGSELGKWASATSHKYGDTSYLFPIAQAGLIDGTTSSSSDGKAPGSTKCLKLSTNDQWCEKLSTKVKVSKDQLVPGKTYTLSMYALTYNMTGGTNTYNSIYASLQSTTTNSNFGLYHEKNGSILPWIFTGRNESNYATGRQTAPDFTRPYWKKFNITITPKETDFDKNGYANLWLTFTDSNFYTNDGADRKMAPGNEIYIDDITITQAQ